MKRELMEFKGQELSTTKIENLKGGGMSRYEKFLLWYKNSQSGSGVEMVQPNSDGLVLAGW